MSFGRNYKQIRARIIDRYPFTITIPRNIVSPPQAEREFGTLGSFCDKPGERTFCFPTERARNDFKAKYGDKK